MLFWFFFNQSSCISRDLLASARQSKLNCMSDPSVCNSRASEWKHEYKRVFKFKSQFKFLLAARENCGKWRKRKLTNTQTGNKGPAERARPKNLLQLVKQTLKGMQEGDAGDAVLCIMCGLDTIES